jgi:pyruvate-formate lyase-activating enzyme
MIIITEKVSGFGKKVTFCDGITVKFNSLGKAEITKEQAKMLFAAGYDWIYEEGSKVIEEPVKKTELDKAVGEQLEEIQRELFNSKDRVKNREDQIKVLGGELAEWKKVATELAEKLKSGGDQATVEVNSFDKEREELKLHISLLECKDIELKNLADSFKVECKDGRFTREERLELIGKLLEASNKQ